MQLHHGSCPSNILNCQWIDSLIHAVDIAKDKLDESSDTYHSTSSELENLNEELLDTTDRMKELETGGISLIEEDEYNKLSAANDELERTIALKKNRKTVFC